MKAGLIAIPLVLLAAEALADAKPEVPTDPWEIIHIARESGEASVGRDKLRDPVIRAESDGVRYQIGFYGCSLGRDCQSILFKTALKHAQWDEEHPEIDIIDELNASKLFGRAILTEW